MADKKHVAAGELIATGSTDQSKNAHKTPIDYISGYAAIKTLATGISRATKLSNLGDH